MITRVLRPAVIGIISVLFIACLLPGWQGRFGASLVFAQAVESQQETSSLQLAPCTHADRSAECGFMRVPENPMSPDGRKIDIRVVVFRASDSPVAPDPIFWLAGGPGVAATDVASEALVSLSSLLRHRDLVLVDQRGVGQSNPLFCPMPDPSEAASPDFSLESYAQSCLTNLNADPRFYTTNIAMDDVDSVRSALGYDQINLYGGSYGATAAQVYLRNHEEHVRSVVLLSGTLLDVPIFEWFASNSQNALDLVFTRCEHSSRCSAAYSGVRSEFLDLLDILEQEPADVGLVDPLTNNPLWLTRSLFTEAVHSMLLGIETSRLLPRYIHEAHESRDFSPFAAYLQLGGGTGTAVMPMVIRCFEDWAAFSPERVTADGGDSYYLAAQIAAAQEQMQTCELLPSAREQARYAPATTSNVPVLLINGEADPQDPPRNVAGANQLWPNSVSVIMPSQGHSMSFSSCRIQIMSDFIEAGSGDELDTSCVRHISIPDFDIGH